VARQPSASLDRVPYGVLLARLGREATARFRCSLKPLGLAPPEFFMLKQLEALGAASQSTVAEAVGMDTSNLATLTAELCRRGLIVRTRDEDDRRRYVVELTDAGRRLLADADRAIETGELEMLEGLAEDERELLRVFLLRMAGSLDLEPETCDGSDEC
jgi:MarR family transcriptional regulator, lower aerobic nicotinate degradation pathway regulator